MILFLKYLWAVVVLLAVVMQGLTIVEADGLNHLMIHIAFMVGLFVCVIDALQSIENDEPKLHFFLVDGFRNGLRISKVFFSNNRNLSFKELQNMGTDVSGQRSPYISSISYIGKMTKTEFLKDS